MARDCILSLLAALSVSTAAAGRCRLTLRRPLCSASCMIGIGRCRGSMVLPPSGTTPPTEWTMVRLFDDGKVSHWSEVSFPFVRSNPLGSMSNVLPTEGVILRWTSGMYNDCHNAPQGQIIASLNGHVEARVSSGEKRRFGPGETLLVEDTKGAGHCTRSLDGVGRWSIFILLRSLVRHGCGQSRRRERLSYASLLLIFAIRHFRGRSIFWSPERVL